jgi:ABC-2 type transport system permease protein
MVKNKRNQRSQSLINLMVTLLVIVIANALGSVYYQRFDLTSEKRYTLSETSLKLAQSLEETLYFRLYLEGEMSAKFKQLKSELRDMAYEFREASGRKIEIEVVDPFEGQEVKDITGILEDFAGRGIEPVRDVDSENPDETRIKYLLPGAEMNYAGKTAAVNFFEYDVAKSPEANIQAAIDNMEYEFANGLRQCVRDKRPVIAVSDGHGEMIGAEVQSFAAELSKFYSVSALNLSTTDLGNFNPTPEQLAAAGGNMDSLFWQNLERIQRRLSLSDLLMIIKPATDFSPADLYLIDQYVMNGGRVLMLLDALNIEIDSFQTNSSNFAFDRNLENLSENLFRYGVKLENTLLMDQNCNQIPVPVSGRMEMMDFFYFPLFVPPTTPHLINKNVGAVWAQFPSSLEAKPREGLQVTPLLSSTPYYKVVQAPAEIDLETSRMQAQDPNYRATMQQNGVKSAGLLLEGQFESPYKYQKHYGNLPFKDKGQSAMIVLADGDLMRNPVSGRGRVYPTGYDRFSQITFANKKFLLNCIDYLVDDQGLIEIRAKERRMRLLDPQKARTEKEYWKWFNLLAPLFTILVLGVLNHFWRLRRYTR